MTLDNMTGITEGSYTGFCKSQLITCNRVKECNGVCPFEDALKHADKEMNEQTAIDHDRDWIIGCIKHDGFIKTDRFDKANQIILEALSAEPTKAVPPSLADVYKWERDIALSQLEEYGIGFAEKKRDDLVEVVRCKDCRHAQDDITHLYCGYFGHKVYEDDYCSHGERQCNYFGERREP